MTILTFIVSDHVFIVHEKEDDTCTLLALITPNGYSIDLNDGDVIIEDLWPTVKSLGCELVETAENIEQAQDQRICSWLISNYEYSEITG